MPLPLPVPNVLGHYFSFASIEARVGIQVYWGFTAINYTTSMEVADVYGTRPQKLGTTRGKQNAEGSAEMYIQDWEILRASLGVFGVGYGEVRFPITVSYGEIGLPVKTDVLEGVRVVSTEYSNSEGNEPSKVSLTLNIMRILENVGGRIDAPLGIGY
jgi:hypothetical protein